MGILYFRLEISSKRKVRAKEEISGDQVIAFPLLFYVYKAFRDCNSIFFIFSSSVARSPQKNTENELSEENIGTCISPVICQDHDYCVPPALAAIERIEELERLLAKGPKRFCLQRLGSDPSLVRFYTGFKDCHTFYMLCLQNLNHNQCQDGVKFREANAEK